MTTSKPFTYQCARCHQEFQSDWSNEEALAEKEQIFGDLPTEQCEVICDDCFQVVTRDKDGATLEHFNTFHNPPTRNSEPCTVDGCFWLKQEQMIPTLSPEAEYVLQWFLRGQR